GVVGIQTDGLAERGRRLGGAALLEKVCVHRAILHRRGDGVAALLERPRSQHARLEVRRIERSEAHDDVVGARRVAARAAAVDDPDEIVLRVGEQSLPGGDLAEVQLDALVVRLDLEDLLVERGRTRVEALVRQVVGDLLVLGGGPVDLTGAHVEIAERVAQVPVARLLFDQADVFRDGGIELALTEQLFRFLQCFFALAGQGIPRSYQTGWAGGTSGGAPRSTRSARRRRGGRASRSPCADRIRSGDRGRGARPWRDRVSPWRR